MHQGPSGQIHFVNDGPAIAAEEGLKRKLIADKDKVSPVTGDQ